MAIFAIKCFGTQENDFRKWEKLMSRISVFNRTKFKKKQKQLNEAWLNGKWISILLSHTVGLWLFE